MQTIFTKTGAANDAAPVGAPPSPLSGRYFAVPQRADAASLAPSGGLACNFVAKDAGAAVLPGVTFTAQLWFYDAPQGVWFSVGAPVAVTTGTQAALRCLALASTLTAFVQITSVVSGGGAVASIDCDAEPVPALDSGVKSSGPSGPAGGALAGTYPNPTLAVPFTRAVVTGNVTLANGDRRVPINFLTVPLNSTRTITLPPTPVDGQQHLIFDAYASLGPNAGAGYLTIDFNGKALSGQSAIFGNGFYLSQPGDWVEFTWNATANAWFQSSRGADQSLRFTTGALVNDNSYALWGTTALLAAVANTAKSVYLPPVDASVIGQTITIVRTTTPATWTIFTAPSNPGTINGAASLAFPATQYASRTLIAVTGGWLVVGSYL